MDDSRIRSLEADLRAESDDDNGIDIIVVHEETVRGSDGVAYRVPIIPPPLSECELTHESEGGAYRVWRVRSG